MKSRAYIRVPEINLRTSPSKLRKSELNGVHVETVENLKLSLALRFVKNSLDRDYNGELDDSERSSARNLLTELHRISQASTASSQQPPSADQISTAVALWGSYLGEVIRRNLGGEWVMDSTLGKPTLLLPKGHKANPFHKVKQRLLNGPADSVHFFYKIVRDGVEKGLTIYSVEGS
jgi:hypothetical protein